MTNWKVFYPDDKTLSGSGQLPTGEGARGVQAVVQDHPEVGAEIVTRSDYYVLENGRVRGVDIFGLFDYLLDSGIVIFGRTISREEYAEIIRQASAAKEGWLPSEVRL